MMNTFDRDILYIYYIIDDDTRDSIVNRSDYTFLFFYFFYMDMCVR